MGIKVAKFGGSSVADKIQYGKIKQLIEADPERRYIVVSAPGKRYDGDSKITDLLYLCQAQREHNIPYDQILQVIFDRFIAIAAILGLGIDEVQAEFEKIKEDLASGVSKDYLPSRGEYLSARLIASYLGYDFVDASGLVQFDKNGRLKMEETDKALGAELKKHKTAVIPGFYGTKEDGSIKTFARGGSDITGSLVARAVGADVYENWTDVSGFLMADPRIVNEPKPIESLTYMELRELSYMGASVLHEDAIYPARLANIPINIKNTNAPEDKGTLITADGVSSDRVVTGIAGSKNFTVIAIYKNMLSAEKGFVRKLLTILDDNDVPLEHMPTGIDTISVVVANDKLEGKLDDILDELKTTLKPDNMKVFTDMSLIATVGSGMSENIGTSGRVFSALGKAGVNIRMIDQGSSEINIIVGVETKDFEKAISAIYDEFEK